MKYRVGVDKLKPFFPPGSLPSGVFSIEKEYYHHRKSDTYILNHILDIDIGTSM